MTTEAEIFDEIAYVYDGSLEGLLSCVFAAYANHENPSEVAPRAMHQPRLSQRVRHVQTSLDHAIRVRRGLSCKGGWSAYNAMRKASCSSQADAGTAAYHFARYVMDEHVGKGRPFSNIAHKKVAPLYAICRSVDQETEHMRQFVRFEHLRGDGADFWFAKCNPRDSVVPLVMPHFVERFNVQPFVIYDEAHAICGVYDGSGWHLVNLSGADVDALRLPGRAAEETTMQDAWRHFYRSVAVDARYNPELRRNFMPKRLWRNLTELQPDSGTLTRAQ